MLKLIVLLGPDAGSEFTSERETTLIGRGSGCDVLLHDGALGRRHCEIREEAGKFVLVDLGSVNGTFVNKESTRITSHTLKNGDEISLGKSCIRVELLKRTKQQSSSASLPSSSSQPVPPRILPPEEVPPPIPPQAPSTADRSSGARVEGPSSGHSPPATGSIPQSSPQLRLRIVEGVDQGKVFELQPGVDRCTVGRGQAANFILHDARVSRIHFVIERTPTGFVLIDNGSMNGTFVDDKLERITRHDLRGGEIIRVCETQLFVEIGYGEDSTVFAPFFAKSTQQKPAISAASSSPQQAVQSEVHAAPEPTVRLATSQLWSVGLIFFSLVAVTCLFVFDRVTTFSSGPVSNGHAPWEGDCTTCHSPWGRQSINATCGATNCHAASLQGVSGAGDACTDCHTEHRGRSFPISGNEQQCWACHETSFPTRPVGQFYRPVLIKADNRGRASFRLTAPTTEAARQAWQESAPRFETGLRFAHAAHARLSRQTNCLTCHQPLPGEIINALAPVSAFPSHAECIECHAEVGDVNPQQAIAHRSSRCQKCHTQADERVVRISRTLAYVRFSHDQHKAQDCTECHFTVMGEEVFRPVMRASLYAVPMEACVSCHEHRRATTACLDCHRAHHAMTAEMQTEPKGTTSLPLRYVLLAVLALQASGGMLLYFIRR